MSNLKTSNISDQTAHEMLRRADEVKANAYPKGKISFAVCVLTDKGSIYEGVSYLSDTYTLTMHCEMVALAHAATHGEHNIVAITGPNCHMCKQLIWESALNSGIDVQIVMQEDSQIKLVPISSLMQYPWPDEKGALKTRSIKWIKKKT